MITPELINRRAKAVAEITFDDYQKFIPKDGLILEFGVAGGDSIRKIAQWFPERTVYGFDSFNGLPEDWRASETKGAFACPIPNDLPKNVQLVVGAFEETLPNWLTHNPGNVAFVHIDSDLYSSAKCVLDNLNGRCVPGSILAFDEILGEQTCLDHEGRAFAEFLNSNGTRFECLGQREDKAVFRLKPPMEVTIYLGNHHAAVAAFVQEGFVIYRGLLDVELVNTTRQFFMGKFNCLESAFAGKGEKDVHGWSVAIARAWERSPLYDQLLASPQLKAAAQSYLGPDVAWLGHDAVFINVPADHDPVTTKPPHQDAWAGTGVNSLFLTIFFTDVDKYNGLSICPGSHLQGLMPVRNRVLDERFNVPFETLDLTFVQPGDVMIWHPLLLHYTTGHSPDKIRILTTSRLTSPERLMTSQERALGYRSMSVGPLNQVLRMIGSDYLTPFRTYGGYLGVDRRLGDLYEHSPYQKQIDYQKYLD